MLQRNRELLNWSRCVSWFIAPADQILQWTWKKKMSRIVSSFQSSLKTHSIIYKFIWFLRLLTKRARRSTSKFMVKKFTDAEKFVRSRRQCSGYFKRVSSRLVTSSRSLPEIVLGTKSRKAFGDFGERSKPCLSLKVSRDCILRSCKGSSFHIVNVAQPHEIHSCPEFLASYPCVALIKFPVLDLRL